MKSFLWSVALLSALAAMAWILVDATVGSPVYLALYVLPVLALWLQMRSVAALPAKRPLRLLFWMFAMPGWLAVISLVQMECMSQHSDERQQAMLVLGITLSGAVWLAVRGRAFPRWGTLGEACAACMFIVIAGAAAIWGYEAQSRALLSRAEAHWAEVGLPMSDFEKTLLPASENAGSEVARKVLRDFSGTPFYKSGTAAAAREPVVASSQAMDDLVFEACNIIGAKLPPGDVLDLSALPVSVIEPHAAALDEAYRSILATEAPAWACNPRDGLTVAVPNFLGIRKFGQIVSADAMRRLAAGDIEGASRALSAAKRLGEKLPENPTLVALMIHVSMESCYAPRLALLPSEGDPFPALAKDAEKMRAEMLRRLQFEGYTLCRISGDIPLDGFNTPEAFKHLPQSVWSVAAGIYFHRQLAAGVMNNADHAAILKSQATLSLPDMGASLHDAVSSKNPSICDINITRAFMRLHSTLLLREQAEIIRDTRARLDSGRTVESRDSVVFPGVRWELAADPEKRTLTTRLVNVPKWITDCVVTPSDFWLLPLDGSGAWQFRPAVRSAAR